MYREVFVPVDNSDHSNWAVDRAIILAVTFTWLMGLMGFARSGIRQHWHVWEVVRDTSKWAPPPALGYAAVVISACVMIFFTLVAFIFWLGGLAEKPIVSTATSSTPRSSGGQELAPAAGY